MNSDNSDSEYGNRRIEILEKELRQKEFLISQLLNSVPWSVWMKDESGNTIYANQHLISFLSNLPHGFSNSYIADAEKEAIEKKQEKWMEISTGDSWYQLYVKPWFSDQDNPQGICGFLRNISKEKFTLLDLLAEREYFRTLMDNIPDTIYFKDTKSRFTRINKAKSTALGIPNPEEAIGKTDFDYFDFHEAQEAFEDEKKIFSTGIPLLDKEEKLTSLEGSEYWVSATKIPVHDEAGNITGLVGISRNITDRIHTAKKLEEAKRKAEESDLLKSAFLANMSHEIRSPMNGIIGFANLLRSDNLSQEKREEYIAHINACSSTLLALIDDIIDISKIEAGQLKIVNSRFDLVSLLDDVLKTCDQVRLNMGKNHVRFFLNTGTIQNSFFMVADPNRLRQILTNLIGNAFKFTEVGYVEFGFTLTADVLNFYVKDTGIGIPENKQPFVFDRFYQVEDAASMNTQGTGLGLAICSNLIQLMGGKISLQSKSGEGSVFSFSIPYLDTSATPELKTEHQADKELLANWKGKQVLIVEDEPSNYLFLFEILKKTGISCLWARNGAEAISAFKDNPAINIILMDLKMPVMDGYEATRKILEINPSLPVIAQTAYAMSEEQTKSIQAGCVEYLTKPIHPETLFAVMEKYL